MTKAGYKAAKPIKPQAAWPARRLALLEELPKHGWDYFTAGIAAGYSRPYARTTLKREALKNPTFCQMVLAKRQEIDAGSTDDREIVRKYLVSVVQDSTGTIQHRDKIQACANLSRMNGWDQTTIHLEGHDRQRILTASEQAEAQKLALIRLQTHLLLPAVAPIDAEIVPESAIGSDEAPRDEATEAPGVAQD